MKPNVNFISKILLAVTLMFSVFSLAPSFAYAQAEGDGGFVNCGKKVPAQYSSTKPSELPAPYKPCTATDFFQAIYYVVNYAISIAGLIAVFYIFWGGAKLLLSRGNPTAVQDAKTHIWYAILGFILIMLSYVIISYVAGLFIPGADPLKALKGFAPGQ